MSSEDHNRNQSQLKWVLDLLQSIDIQELSQRVEALQRDMRSHDDKAGRLQIALAEVAAAGTVSKALDTGFQALSEQLMPLRDIEGRDRTPLDQVALERLSALRESLDVPDWTNAGRLPAASQPVRFIGDPLPPQPRGSMTTP